MKFRPERSLVLAFRDDVDTIELSFLLVIDVGISTTTGLGFENMVSLRLRQLDRGGNRDLI